MPRSSLAAVALLLAGCASGVPVERQTVVPGGRFSNVSGEARFIVRTALEDAAGGPRREVVGASCTALSSLFKAEFVSPSRLVVPNFGPQSPEITVSCSAGGLQGSATTKILTRWDGPPYYPGWSPGWGPAWAPGWGPGWGADWGAGWGWPAPGYPVSEYPDLLVTLR
jgi:hypothetical protein